MRNYRIVYAMARALENYAVLGDHQEDPPYYKAEKALLRAIELLNRSGRKARTRPSGICGWLMDTVSLHQEEKAIPYAQRWAELDPEDEDAPAVIQACQEEIAKRAEAEAEDESDHTGVFTGFVLLSKGEWDKAQFIQDMKEKWDITVDEYDASEEKTMMPWCLKWAICWVPSACPPFPIPGGEAEANAENNYMWEDAVKIAREHRAHIMVAVLGKEKDLLEKASCSPRCWPPAAVRNRHRRLHQRRGV